MSKSTTKTVGSEGNTNEGRGTRLKNVLQSVFAAALGVQSSKNRERDFQEGSAGTFIVAGLIFTALFIASVIAVVQMVIPDK